MYGEIRHVNCRQSSFVLMSLHVMTSYILVWRYKNPIFDKEVTMTTIIYVNLILCVHDLSFNSRSLCLCSYQIAYSVDSTYVPAKIEIFLIYAALWGPCPR